MLLKSLNTRKMFELSYSMGSGMEGPVDSGCNRVGGRGGGGVQGDWPVEIVMSCGCGVVSV